MTTETLPPELVAEVEQWLSCLALRYDKDSGPCRPNRQRCATCHARPTILDLLRRERAKLVELDAAWEGRCTMAQAWDGNAHAARLIDVAVARLTAARRAAKLTP